MNVVIRTDISMPALAAKIAALKDKSGLHRTMGMGVEKLVIRHLREVKVPQGNRLGAPSTGFWQKAIASVVGTSGDAGASVRITHRGAAMQYYGGTVRPVRARALTIPIDAEAHGKTVGDFRAAGVEIFKLKGKDLLCRKVGDEVKPLFILRANAIIDNHPDVLPTRDELAEAAVKAGRAHMRGTKEVAGG